MHGDMNIKLHCCVTCTHFFLWPNSPNRISTASLFFFIDHIKLDTHSVERLWTSDQPVRDAATYTTHTKHKARMVSLT